MSKIQRATVYRVGIAIGLASVAIALSRSLLRTAPVTRPTPLTLVLAGPLAAPGWRRESTSAIRLDPSRQYVATLQLHGLESLFGDREAVAAELRKLGSGWTALDVYDDPRTLPRSLPVTREADTGRYWAVGIPARVLAARGDDHIVSMWSRSRPLAIVTSSPAGTVTPR